MEVHSIQANLDGLAELDFRQLSSFNSGEVGVFWSSGGTSPWERHPDDDGLLQVIEGSVDIEVLSEDGSDLVHIPAGSLFVVPRGRWHRHRHTGPVKELYVTPGRAEISFADDPR